MINEQTTIDKLIQLSKIFKAGYTVEIKNGEIQQYNDVHKPYIVSYTTIVEIHENINKFKTTDINTAYCLIGGWFNKDTNIYHIEFNMAFHNKRLALIFARQQKQKAIYNLVTQETIHL